MSDKEGNRLEVGGIILAIRPEFVEAIFAGRKRFELRRRRPAIDLGGIVYIYCTAPRQAIVGQFTCREVHGGSLEELWGRFGGVSSLSQDGFWAYFRGVERGYALEIDQVRRWEQPLGLEAIRRITPRFWPPQFHRRVLPDEPLVRCLAARGERSRGPGLGGLGRRKLSPSGCC